ncbi:hypothetical protein ES703_50723 [subsurface metagenome]
MTDRAISVKLQKTSMRSAMDNDLNHMVLASIVSCCLSCRIVCFITYILPDYAIICNKRPVLDIAINATWLLYIEFFSNIGL